MRTWIALCTVVWLKTAWAAGDGSLIDEYRRATAVARIQVLMATPIEGSSQFKVQARVQKKFVGSLGKELSFVTSYPAYAMCVRPEWRGAMRAICAARHPASDPFGGPVFEPVVVLLSRARDGRWELRDAYVATDRFMSTMASFAKMGDRALLTRLLIDDYELGHARRQDRAEDEWQEEVRSFISWEKQIRSERLSAVVDDRELQRYALAHLNDIRRDVTEIPSFIGFVPGDAWLASFLPIRERRQMVTLLLACFDRERADLESQPASPRVGTPNPHAEMNLDDVANGSRWDTLNRKPVFLSEVIRPTADSKLGHAWTITETREQIRAEAKAFLANTSP